MAEIEIDDMDFPASAAVFLGDFRRLTRALVLYMEPESYAHAGGIGIGSMCRSIDRCHRREGSHKRREDKRREEEGAKHE